MDLLNELNRCVYPHEYTPIDFSDEDQRVEAIDTFADYYKYNDYNQTLTEMDTFNLTDQIQLEILTELYGKIKTSTDRENFDVVGNTDCIKQSISIVLHLLYTRAYYTHNYAEYNIQIYAEYNIQILPIKDAVAFCKTEMELLPRVIFYIQFVASVLIYAEECYNLVLK